jgi:hypothetical protein
MEAYRIETTVRPDGSVKLEGLPYAVGQAVEVVVLPHDTRGQTASYSLRGTPITYVDPTDPVSAEDWEAGA